MQLMEALKQAITAAGSMSALAAKLGVTRQAIENWFERGIPAERVREVEEAVSGAVTRDSLRPDLYEGYVRAPGEQA